MKLRSIFAVMLLAVMLTGCATNKSETKGKTYEHVQFTSKVTTEGCAICGEHPDVHWYWYKGQDNVAIVDVNTFDFSYIEINRYNPDGSQITETAGYMKMSGGEIGAHHISGMVDPDRGLARLNGTLSSDPIDASAIESFLCQECLDEFASHYFEHDNVYSLAVFNFAAKTLRPLVESSPWYAADNYSVDCHYEDDGKIDITVYYCPPRFAESE